MNLLPVPNSSSTQDTTSSKSTVPTTRSQNPASGPSGFDHLLHPQQSSTAPYPRFHLHIRQQPIAARACGAGDKDRRAIDPLPILQLLITDFSPDSPQDIEALNYKLYVVGCQLFSIATDPKTGAERRTHASNIVERGSSSSSNSNSNKSRHETGDIGGGGGGVGVDEFQKGRSVQVLSGRTYVSPFFVDADPEPHRAPIHPRSSKTQQQPQHPQQYGTSHLLPPMTHPTPTPSAIPSTFFIFADLSVRTSGTYRLRFRLADVGRAAESRPGTSTPILDEVWTQPFQVYAAKDFPGMRETPYLTEQLKGLGASGIKTRRKEKGVSGGRKEGGLSK